MNGHNRPVTSLAISRINLLYCIGPWHINRVNMQHIIHFIQDTSRQEHQLESLAHFSFILEHKKWSLGAELKNMVVMDDFDNIGTLTPYAVVNHIMSKASSTTRRCALIDCRSFLSFNDSHVRSAVNIHCPPILKRRLHRGSATSDSLLTNAAVRDRVNEAETLIFYDERTLSWSELENDSTIKIVSKLLRRDFRRKHLYYIKGGFELFSSTYPSMCDFSATEACSKTAPVGLTSPVSLRIKNSEIHKSTSPSRYNGMEKDNRPRQVLRLQGAEPVEILPYLYLGSEANSCQKDELKHLGITAIMNVSKNIPNSYPDSFKYKCIPVDDTYNADIGRWFAEAAEYIDSIKGSGGCVLVHCQAGVSRSATICLAYLISRQHLRLDEAYEFVKTRRAVISPNFNFMGQLLNWETEIHSTGRKNKDITTPVKSCSGSQLGFFTFGGLPCGTELSPSGNSTTSSPELVTTPM